ncbi:MAG: LptF/LptG family permease [Bacteroidota bacterium]
MKKIDKLIITAFLGPFVLTFFVVVFILLTVQMMNYVDEIFGKDLQWVDLGKLIFHFSIFQTPIAFPLSIMLASLMAFGNLGEHFELTAIKGAGISLVRALFPIYIMVVMVTVLAFYSNNYFVPYSALKAYSLLYDIRQKKPSLDIQPGQFYAGIENYKIKVDKKLTDGKTLKGLTIYDHSAHKGNSEVIMADSGIMYTILNDQYLKFELFNGTHYVEGQAPKTNTRGRRAEIPIAPFTRTSFAKSEMIFDLSSFSLERTDEGLFASHRLMRNFTELGEDLDSLQEDISKSASEIFSVPERYFKYAGLRDNIDLPKEIHELRKRQDSLRKLESERQRFELMASSTKTYPIEVQPPPVYEISLEKPAPDPKLKPERIESPKKKADPPRIKRKLATEKLKKKEDNLVYLKKDSVQQVAIDTGFSDMEMLILERYDKKTSTKTSQARNLKSAVATARQVKSKLSAQNNRKQRVLKKYYEFDIQWHKMIASAIACLSMFLIGAPLGAIIKRGGIGFPVIVSVIFFIIYYVITIGGEKYAKAGNISVEVGVWAANFILFPIGLLFLRQAKNDARLFEADFYKVMLSKYNEWFGNIKNKVKQRKI